MKRLSLLSTVVLFVIGVSFLSTGCGSPTSSYPDSVPGNSDIGLAESPGAPSIPGGTGAERALADAINQFRVDKGLNALEWSDELADAERSHSYDMQQRGYFGHGSSADPGNYDLAIERGDFLAITPPGYLYETAASWPSALALQAWKDSPPHRAALLNPDLLVHGVGISPNDTRVCWASIN